MGIEDRIVNRINSQLGGRVEDLHKSKELVNKFVEEINSTERKVSQKCKIHTK
jgi:hypothetical protein